MIPDRATIMHVPTYVPESVQSTLRRGKGPNPKIACDDGH